MRGSGGASGLMIIGAATEVQRNSGHPRGAGDGPHRQRPGGAVAGAGQGRPRPRGGPGGHLRLVLGRRPVAGVRCQGAPGAPAGGQDVRLPAGQDRRRDSTNLAELLRMGRLPEAWLAPPQVRELRELVRYRAKLVALRSGLKAQVHAVLAKQGVRVPMSDLFGVAGTRLLEELRLPRAYGLRVASLRELL